MNKFIFKWSILVTGFLLVSFHEKKKPYEIIQDKNVLVYSVSYDNENYRYEVKVEKSKKATSFNYRILGGSKILSGFFNAPLDYNFKQSGLAMPGCLLEGDFEPFMLNNKAITNKLVAMKWGAESDLMINNKNYKLTANGTDSFSFASKKKNEDDYINAKYFTVSEGEKEGSLIVGTGVNKHLILELSMPSSFSMKLDSVK